MVLVNFAMHTFVTHHVSPVKVLSYVDNWEAQSTCPDAICDAFEAMDRFAQTLDIQLDKAKTYFWATSAKCRKTFKTRGHVVLLHSKDLVGHLNYSKRGTNYSLRARTTKCKPMWGWLSRSHANTTQKLRVLHSVAWPRCLHGIAGVDIGIDHFTTLRASAMQAKRWEKHGSSSCVQFGLITEPRFDPAFYATLMTVTEFRKYSNSAIAYEVLDQLVTQPPSRILPGPCGVLLSRLHAIHWRWEGNGFLRDHQGLLLHTTDSPIQLLRMRLEHAWAASVGHKLASRAEFHGLADVDVSCSTHTARTFSQVEQGLLRVAMNGSFFTRDKQFSSGKFLSKQCPWCEVEDSVHHRTWECPHFQHQRAKLSQAQVQFIFSQPECTRLHGWFIETEVDTAYRRSLMNIPDTTGVFECCHPLPDTLHLFTDGSGLDPNVKALRLVTWSVCLAQFPEVTFLPVAAGGVPGLIQTVLKAEITAVIAACKFAIHTGRQFYIWTDC